MAIQSIPWYVSAASYFVVLAGSSWVHENGKIRGAAEWARRGWCRLEQMANFLSAVEKPMIICQSLCNIESYPARGNLGNACPRYGVGEGEFTVDDDRKQLGPVILQLIASKQANALKEGDLVTYRVLHVMTDRMLANTGTTVAREQSLSDFLAALQLSSPTDGDRKLSALHYAVVAGRVDFVEELLDQGADPKALTGDVTHLLDLAQEGTPLLALAASCRYQPAMVQMLLGRGHDPRDSGAKGFKSLMGNAFVLSVYQAQTVGADASAADLDASQKYRYNFDVLLEHDPTLITSRASLFGGSNSALGCGMCGAGLEFFQHVLAKYPERVKVELSEVDGMGATWLIHYLNYLGDPEVIMALLDAGLDATHTEWPPNGTVRTFMKVFRTLFRLMRKPDNVIFHFANFFGQPRPTYLHLAAAYAQTPALKYMLENTRLDVNGTNVLGATPLHLAARQGHVNVVDILLAAGANPNAKAERGRRPSDMARRRGHTALAERLKLAEAKQRPWRARGRVGPEPSADKYAAPVEVAPTHDHEK